MSGAELTFKTASEAAEFEQIHELNYRTFVDEIPQHAENVECRLVDQFDAENTYLIALRGSRLVGMIAVRGNRPFSLDAKLDRLDEFLPAGRSVCELRLLSVAAEERGRWILPGLMRMLADQCEASGYDLAIISGTTRQQKLYRRLGFVPFGPLVGTSDALFQPMYLTRELALERSRNLLERCSSQPERVPVNLLPGPVNVHPDVRRAFAAGPVSHRSPAVVDEMRQVHALLRDLTGAASVHVMMGSGTLANDAVAAQLALHGGRGMVLSNGEFGERLIDHAIRAGLSFETLRVEWGSPFAADAIEAAAASNQLDWLWAVHSETSTGVLNDIVTLKSVAGLHKLKLCLDCISSIGVLPVELTGVYLATGVSGKGLGAFPGLSIVFADHAIEPEPTRLPRYLDLGLYEASAGIPFTLSSNLLHALLAAVSRNSAGAAGERMACLSSWLRDALEAAGATVLAPVEHASPAVLTLVFPRDVSSLAIGRRMSEAGYLLSFESRYLIERNWIQICLMGEHSRHVLEPLVELLVSVGVPDATLAGAALP